MKYQHNAQQRKQQTNKKRTPQANTKSVKCHHDKVKMDQQETGQAMSFLRHYDISHVEIFASSITKLVLLIGHNHIDKTIN